MTGRRGTSPLTPLPVTPGSMDDIDEDQAEDGGDSSSPSLSASASYQGDDGPATLPDDIDQSNLFYIGRIIARSVDTYPPHATPAEQEHNYLVRWWGEEPSSDTWEARSVLLSTARETVEAFDQQGLSTPPFPCAGRGIQLINGEHGSTEYLIRYGWSSRNQGHSPHAEEVWHTAVQAEKTMGISAITFENAIQAWSEGLAPNPRAPVAAPVKPKKVPPRPTTRQAKAGYKLIGIIDEQPDGRTFANGRAQSKQKVKWRVLVEYRIRRGKIRQEWFAKSYLTTLFGTEQVKQAREAMEVEQAPAGSGAEEISGQDTVDAYEAERIKNIDANKELLRSLGLAQ